MNGESIRELLCAPLSEGQAVLELVVRQRILPETDLYSRKRRLRHMFFVRAGDRIVKFEVRARVSLLPARISVTEIQELAAEAVREDIEDTVRERIGKQMAETDPEFGPLMEQTVENYLTDARFEERVADIVQRLLDTYTRDGVIIENR